MTKYSIALKINLGFTSLFRNKAIFSIIKFELIVKSWILEFSFDGTTLTDFPELLISNSRVEFFVLLFITKNDPLISRLMGYYFLSRDIFSLSNNLFNFYIRVNFVYDVLTQDIR